MKAANDKKVSGAMAQSEQLHTPFMLTGTPHDWQFDFNDFGNDFIDQQMIFESPNTDLWGSDNGVSLPSAQHISGDSAELQDCDPNVCVQVLSESADMSTSLVRHYRYDQHGRYRFKELVVQAVTENRDAVHFLVSPRTLARDGKQKDGPWQREAEQLRADLSKIVAPDVGSRLIMLCHQHICPQYPIFSSQQWPNPDTSFTGLLAAIYMAVQPFIKFDDRLAVDLVYEAPQSSALSKIVQRSLELFINTPDLSTIQTLILMVLQPSSNPVVSDGSLKGAYMGLLVAAAQTLGLHLNPTGWTIPAWQISLRRRLAHIVYSTDKWLACGLGRPPLLHADNWLVTSLSMDDSLDSGLETVMWLEQMRYSELCEILDEVLVGLL